MSLLAARFARRGCFAVGGRSKPIETVSSAPLSQGIRTASSDVSHRNEGQPRHSGAFRFLPLVGLTARVHGRDNLFIKGESYRLKDKKKAGVIAKNANKEEA